MMMILLLMANVIILTIQWVHKDPLVFDYNTLSYGATWGNLNMNIHIYN